MSKRVVPVLVFLLSIAVVGLSAHLKVERTTPVADSTVAEAPTRIQVWFSQNPTMAVSALSLEGPQGTVELGKVEAGRTDGKPDRSLVAPVIGRLVPGAYTATWKTSGSDGHIQTETFTFTFTPGS